MFFEEFDEFRNPAVVAREREEKKRNSVTTRVVDSILDVTNNMMNAQEFAIRMQYRDRQNDSMQRKNDKAVYSQSRVDTLEDARERRGPDSRSRRDDLRSRTEALHDSVRTPSSEAEADFGMDY